MLRKIVLFSLLILSATYFVLQKSGYFTTYTGLNRIDQIADYNPQGYGTPDSGKPARASERSGRDLPVHAAAKNGQLEHLKQEVKNKEHIEALDAELRTPLYLAVKFKQLEAAKFLISVGADVNSRNLQMEAPPLFVAAQNNDVAMIKLLIQNHASIEKGNVDGVTPLIQAAWQAEHPDTTGAEELLAAGAKISATDNAGYTAAHLAAQSGRLTFLSLLAQRKADLNVKSLDGDTPLMMAVRGRQEAAVKYLLNSGISPDLMNYRGLTPLMAALQDGSWNVANVLIEGGANTNRRSLDGASPVFEAGMAGHTATVEALLKHGANPKEMYDGVSIRYWLRKKGQNEVANLLDKYGGQFDDMSELRKKSVARREMASVAKSIFVDNSNLLSPPIQHKFSEMLNSLYNETGVDMRIALLRGESKGDINPYAAKIFTEMGIGKDNQGQGILFVYDHTSNQARIEVGHGAEGFLPDVLVGYVLRENFLPLAKSEQLELALRFSLNIFAWRIREAVLKDAFDPRALALMASDSYLSGGAGSSLKIDKQMKQSNLDMIQSKIPTGSKKTYSNPENAYFAYLNWLVSPEATSDLGFFTGPSAQYVKSFPLTKGYRDHMLLMEYGKKYKMIKKGDLAMQIFTDSPLPCPHFYVQEKGSWQISITDEVRNAKSIVGGGFSWFMADKNSNYYKTFIDDLANVDLVIRFEVGDNRPLPVRAMGKL